MEQDEVDEAELDRRTRSVTGAVADPVAAGGPGSYLATLERTEPHRPQPKAPCR